MMFRPCINAKVVACEVLIATWSAMVERAHGQSLLRRSKLAAKELELAAAHTDLEAVEAEAASMASAYDDDRAALEKKRQALLLAQEERSHQLEQLAARRTLASDAAMSAKLESKALTAEVNPMPLMRDTTAQVAQHLVSKLIVGVPNLMRHEWCAG